MSSVVPDANLHAQLHDEHQLLRQGWTWPASGGALIRVGVTGEAAEAGTGGDEEEEGVIPSSHSGGGRHGSAHLLVDNKG
jgi:hypothetical protein